MKTNECRDCIWGRRISKGKYRCMFPMCIKEKWTVKGLVTGDAFKT